MVKPSFASGGSVPELVQQGLLVPECERIFRRKSGPHAAVSCLITATVERVPDGFAVLVAQFSQGGLHGAFIEPLANSDRRPGCEGTLGALHCCLSLRQ